jgi:hypothetical protein
MPRRTLTWNVKGQMPAKLNPADVVSTIDYALREWAKVCYVGFSFNTEGQPVDITFRFGRVSRSDWAAEHIIVDGRHLITFSDDQKWATYKPGLGGFLSRFFNTGKDLLTSTLHETGHMLGLGHADGDELSVMYPATNKRGLLNKPSPEDGFEARRIYPFP